MLRKINWHPTQLGSLILVAICSACLPVSDGRLSAADTALAQTYQSDTDEALYHQNFRHNSIAEKQFVSQLLNSMSLEQKVAQMVQAEISEITPEQAGQYGIGSVLNGGGSFPYKNKHASREQWLTLANDYYAKSHTIPLLWGTDAIHGHNNRFGATLFPHNIGLGAANNPALTKQVYAQTAKDVRSTGIKWVFAPTVAVAQDARWGRTYESFSEDPALVSQLGVAAVEGLQGDGLGSLAAQHTVIASAKHFVGDGATINGIDQGNAELSEEELLRIHGSSFQQAIDRGVQTVMASFNSWNGEKVHGHEYLLTTTLKQRMGFNGFVIGDWNGHGQITGCSNDDCAQAINAGVDMLMAPKDWQALIANTLNAVNSGQIKMARIDDANRRILSVKYRAGLFDTEQRLQPTLSEEQLDRLDQQSRLVAREAVQQSLVLLKNNDATLPIPRTSKVLLIGSAADNIAMQSGGWSLTWQGDGNNNSDFPGGTSIKQAFERALDQQGKLEFLSIAKLQAILELRSDEASAIALEDFDTAVFVYGEAPYAEGAGDLRELRLPNNHYAYLGAMKALSERGLSISSVLLTGRPLSANEFINASDAFVVAWLPGTEASGISDVLIADQSGTAKYDFTGRLPFTWPAAAKDTNLRSIDQTGDIQTENEQFPLGYGLSYKRPSQLAQLIEHDANQRQQLVVNGTLPIFVKSVSDPWVLYVGDDENWSVNVKGNSGATANNKTLTVSSTDNLTQEDARKLRWSALKYAQFYFQHQQGVNITELAKNNGALTFKVKVEVPPDDAVDLRMDCHYPCMGQLDFTSFLRKLPRDEWQSVAVDLDCFAKQGAVLSQINTPFLIGTSGKLSLEIADISIQTPEKVDKRYQCAGFTAQTALN